MIQILIFIGYYLLLCLLCKHLVSPIFAGILDRFDYINAGDGLKETDKSFFMFFISPLISGFLVLFLVVLIVIKLFELLDKLNVFIYNLSRGRK